MDAMTASRPDDTRAAAPPSPGRITLVRHGRPDADRTVRISWTGYRRWWADYDLAGLREGQPPPPENLQDIAKGADRVLSSTLPRSLETAQAVVRDKEIVTDPVFIEAPLPSPPLPGLRLKPGTWGVISRILWWLGYSAGGESRRDAEIRAEQAADRLVAEAATGSDVVLFAHGWFNRMLRPALKRRGYRCFVDRGDSYWAYRRYEPAGR